MTPPLPDIETATLPDLVGNTPLVEIPYRRSDRVRVVAKCEWFNPSGSVKDRAATAIFMHALKAGALAGKVLIDATSGNTGIAFAMLGAYFGVPVELALPQNASAERICILRNYGVTLHLTNPLEGTDGAQRFVQQRVASDPDRYYYADQYNNPHNWQAHYTGTGPEIWVQTQSQVTHFVAGLGTTGTFVGASRFLAPHGVCCVAAMPDAPMHGLEGWKHLPSVMVPGIYDPALAQDLIEVSTVRAYEMAIAASRYLGLQISPSAGANLAAAFQMADQLDSGIVVTIFPDNAMKYLQEPFWDDSEFHIPSPF